MTFDTWMKMQNPKYLPSDDSVALRNLRDCWYMAQHYSDVAKDREQTIDDMRDKCRKVGAGGTAILDNYRYRWAIESEQNAIDLLSFVRDVGNRGDSWIDRQVDAFRTGQESKADKQAGLDAKAAFQGLKAVDALLADAGYTEDSTTRNLLSCVQSMLRGKV